MMSDSSGNKWKLVQNKSSRSKPNEYAHQKGRAFIVSDSKFRAANVKIPLFTSNVDTEASKHDIISYINIIVLFINHFSMHNVFKFYCECYFGYLISQRLQMSVYICLKSRLFKRQNMYVD